MFPLAVSFLNEVPDFGPVLNLSGITMTSHWLCRILSGSFESVFLQETKTQNEIKERIKTVFNFFSIAMISLYRKSYITEKNRRPPERQSKGDVEGSIDQRFDKLTDPKQPRIPEQRRRVPIPRPPIQELPRLFLGRKL